MVVKPDLFDGLIFAGIALVGTGLWLIAPAVSLIVLGLMVAGTGLYGSWRQGKAGGRP